MYMYIITSLLVCVTQESSTTTPTH